jgi:O-antigen/teichoic acid export membrane protein
MAPSSSAATPSAGRVLVSNTVWRSAAFGARTVGGLVATILVARTLGPHDYGRFQFALALTLLLSFVVMLGLPKLLVRELARDPDATLPRVDSALFICLVAGGAIGGPLLGIGWLAGADTSLLVMAGLTMISDSMARIVMAIFWAFERMRYEAVTVGIQESAFVALTLLALALGGRVEGVMLAYLTSRVVGFVVAWVIAATKFSCPTRPRRHAGVVRPMLKATMPFAIDDGLSVAYVRIDAVLLGIFKGPTAVGLYQSATNLVLYLNVLPRMLNMSMYPQMSRAWPDHPWELRRLRDESIRLLGAVAIPITVGSFLLAPQIFGVLYGPKFEPAVRYYQLLVLVIPLRMLGNTLGTAITSVDRQGQRAFIVGVAAALNVGLNLILIPIWSIMGAVVATLVTESWVFLAYAVLLRRLLGPSRLLSALAAPILACVPLALVVTTLSPAPLALLIVAGAAAYVVALIGIVLVTMPRPDLNPRAIVTSFLAWSA